MDWLTDLLKHLSVSRSITGATFVTALVMYVGPRLLPSFVDPVPKEWAPVVVVALVFSGSLLLFWGVSALWRLFAHGAGTASKALAAIALSVQEDQMLFFLSGDPSTPMNLHDIDYTRAPFTKLELIELAHGLVKKGLVELNPWDECLVTLTASGRKRALELQRRIGTQIRSKPDESPASDGRPTRGTGV